MQCYVVFGFLTTDDYLTIINLGSSFIKEWCFKFISHTYVIQSLKGDVREDEKYIKQEVHIQQFTRWNGQWIKE